MPARLATALLALLAMPGPALASVWEVLAPPPGMEVVHDETRAPDIYAVPLHPAGEGGPVTEGRQGRVVWRSFRGAEPATPLGAVGAAAAPLQAAGFQTVFDCADRACGGFDFRLAIDLLPQPSMMMNPADFHQRTLAGTAPDGAPVTVSLLASRFDGVTHLQSVTVVGSAPSPSAAPPPAPSAAPPPPLADPMPPYGGVATPEAMAALLERQGHLVLEGLDFDSAATAKAVEDAPVLDAAAAMLDARPGLSVVLVGHSDTVGGLEANIRLSRARAAVVLDALVARGVPRDRLSAEGAGWLAPRRSNATPEGRAANRRVEMVLRN